MQIFTPCIHLLILFQAYTLKLLIYFTILKSYGTVFIEKL